MRSHYQIDGHLNLGRLDVWGVLWLESVNVNFVESLCWFDAGQNEVGIFIMRIALVATSDAGQP